MNNSIRHVQKRATGEMVNYIYKGVRIYGEIVAFDTSDGWYLVTNSTGIGSESEIWVVGDEFIGPTLTDVELALTEMIKI